MGYQRAREMALLLVSYRSRDDPAGADGPSTTRAKRSMADVGAFPPCSIASGIVARSGLRTTQFG